MYIIDYLCVHWISLVGAIIGLWFLYLEYKANIYMWLASIAMAVFYIYIFYTTQLYASMAIYIYFFLASIYGWLRWIMKNRNANEDKIYKTERAPNTALLPTVLGIVLAFIFIYAILHLFTANPLLISLGDALTTSLNIIALWMVSHKWAEQWLLVIPANALSGALLLVQGDVLAGSMFFIYFVVSIAGYFNWKRLSKEEITH